MRVDEEIRKKLLENLEKWKKELNREIDYYLDLIREAERVEYIMHLKKRLLLKFLNYFPINREHCYFCIMKELGKFDTCTDCPYAKHHQECYWKYSDYAIIIKHHNILYELIDKLYYCIGEEYEENLREPFYQGENFRIFVEKLDDDLVKIIWEEYNEKNKEWIPYERKLISRKEYEAVKHTFEQKGCEK